MYETESRDNVVKEPVKIRFKELKNGNKSIYLDCYVNGGREYKFLNLYLCPEVSREDKKWNKEQMQLANAIKAQYIVDIQNGKFGLKDKNRTHKLNFIAYCEDMAAKYAANGQTSCAVLMRSAILRMVRYKGTNITFSHVDKEFLIGYIDFLNYETSDFNKDCKDKDRKPRPLSDVYKEALFARIMVALNQTERDGIIIKNPGKDIDRKLKPHSEQKTRCYLTLDEVKKIIELEYRPDNDVKPAFLFCCFSGLRFSDVQKMSWGEITVTAYGQAQLETKMKKMGKSIWVPLSDNALKWLPERDEASDDDRVFANLPDQASNADSRLKTLINHAGITKHVTFHCGETYFCDVDPYLRSRSLYCLKTSWTYEHTHDSDLCKDCGREQEESCEPYTYYIIRCLLIGENIYLCHMEQIIENIPTGTSKEEIKVREKVIKDFYARWISEHPDKKIWNENLQDYILVKYQSINETYNKAARRYESTLAVFRLTEVMEKAVLKSEKKTKPGDKNQKPYSKLLIMFHDGIKLTVGVQKTTQEKVQYCLTAVGATQEQ